VKHEAFLAGKHPANRFADDRLIVDQQDGDRAWKWGEGGSQDIFPENMEKNEKLDRGNCNTLEKALTQGTTGVSGERIGSFFKPPRGLFLAGLQGC